MLKSMKAALAALTGGFALGTCASCATAPYIPGAKTAEAVKEECANRPADQTVYCLTGVYDGVVIALADERAAGTLSPAVDAKVDDAIQFLSPRVATVKELYGKVSKWQTEVETLMPLAENCQKLFSKDEDKGALTQCLTEIGFLAVSGKLSEVKSEAVADWGELEPRLRDFIKLGKQETGD